MQQSESARLSGVPISILFVCMGNICRSPLAELAVQIEASTAGLSLIVDSAGTGDWHVGLAPDRRARAVAKRFGHSIDHHLARQIMAQDFTDFDYIVALDAQNLADLRSLQPENATARLSVLFDHVEGREGEGVFDPYYRDEAAFLETWDDVTAGARGLIAMLVQAGMAQSASG